MRSTNEAARVRLPSNQRTPARAALLAVVVLLLGADLRSAPVAGSASAGLVAAYALAEGAGSTVADASGNGNTGTINGATWTTAGRYGSALSFNGSSSYVDLGNPASLQITGSMSWSAWIYATANPGDDGQIIAKSTGGSGGAGWQLKTSPDTGPHTFGVGVSSNGTAVTQRYSTTTRNLNTWYFVAGVYNASAQTLHIYVNGVLDDGVLSGTVPSSQFNPAQNINIGRRSGGFYFQGTIDEVRMYNRALTQAEIQTDMNTPIAPSTDQTPPTAVVTAPAANTQVSDIVNITADAGDNVGVAGVQFLVDGNPTGAEDLDAPYGVAWDTRSVPNGAHTVAARARDSAGNQTTSAPVSVNVANTNHFQNEVLATGFDLPTNIEFLPDGRMLVVELAGKILVLPPPYTQADSTPFLQLTNVGSAGVQQGIYDIVLDPDFTTNRYYYIFYTLGSPNRDRLSRFTANASLTGTVQGSEFVLYQDPQDANAEHHGGALNFGNDGKLYFTTGEHFNAGDSQLLTSRRGKIHRINKDGTVPTDNPFYDGNGPNIDSIWALGLRNPFRAYYDAPTGRFFIGDVGGNDYSTAKEEVNLGVAGANYGWPECEGICGSPFTDPIYTYPHNGRDAAVVSGFVYHGTQFPSSYRGAYFFADYTQNWIKYMTFDAGGNVNGVFNFEPPDGTLDGPYGDIVYLTEGPDGALYYVDLGYSDIGGTFGVSKIRRIKYVQSNQGPVAVVSADTTAGPAPLTVAFSSAGSLDPEGQPLSYSWTFGDGGSSNAANPSHVYTQPGRYTARLSLSDGTNTTLSTPIVVSVGNPPTATILSPQDGATFRAGDVISYSGDGSDPEDGALPASAFTWNIDFLHAQHVHPGIPVTGVKSGTFTIPTSGHDFSGDTRYRISLTVTDSVGLTSTSSVIIYPRKVNLTFSTVPAGLTVHLDGIAKTTPFVYDDLVGFSHTVEARDQTSGGTSYVFSSWSDGGAKTHQIVVPDTDQSYVATFQASAGPTPVAAYGFNEGSGTTLNDASGNALNGTISNGTWTTAGKYGGALTFNGTSTFVDLGNPALLRIAGSMTWSAWVYATGNPPDDGQIVAKSGGGAGTSGWQFKTSPDTGPHTFGVGVSSNGSSTTQRYSTTARTLNTWYHVAGVYDAAAQALHIYVNGVLDDGALVGTVPASQFDPTQNVNIGRRGSGFYFQGRLDELRIYKAALTQAQIQSDMATPIGGSSQDTQAPTVPTNLAATAVSASQVNLSWTASTDNVGVTGYRVERCQGATCSIFTEIAQPTGTTYNDTSLVASATYRYRVRAVDAVPNFSPYSTIANATTPDTQAPTAPTNLAATAVSQSQVNLSWTASTDNVGVTGYRVERCQGATCSIFTEIAQPTGTTYNDTSLVASATYRYRVRAVDAVPNFSPYSTIANATTPDTQAPTAPTNLAATAVSQSQVNLSWTASTDNVGVTGYRVERCQGATCSIFTEIAQPTGTTYNDTSLVASATYRYRVRAVDAVPNFSPYSTIANATTPDTQAPTAPTNLAATAVSASQVNLSWTASTDNVGVTGYRVERCQGATCSIFTEIAQPTGTTYNDTSLVASATYRYRVRAVDAVPNFSPYSTIANATTPDTQAPTAPTNLAATAVSASQVNLSWTASTDNVGVTGYRVERCQGATCSIFAEIAQPTATTYNDTNLSANTTYRYQVRAVDGVPNLSPYSTIASATTPAGTSGLVAAYSFNEGAGAAVADSSGSGNTGTIGSATWTTAGKYGNALVFNGTDARVDISDAPSLHLSTGMTLEAWVNPQTVSNAWRDVIYKGNDNYYLSATSTRSSRPAAGGTFGGGNPIDSFGTAALAINTWTHLAATYDGSVLRLYVNGVQVSTRNRSGPIATSTNALSIGGDVLYGQYFTGRIDEARVYSVARTQAQIQADMNTPL